MRRQLLAAGLLGIALATVATGTARGTAAAAVDPRKATLDTMRAIGSAMYYWAVDAAGKRAEQAEPEVKALVEPAVYRWSDCPAVTYEEAQRLLVPAFLAELPRTDGWGHPLELCIDREGVKTHGHLVLGVRSAGADGRFDGDSYTAGAFDRTQLDHDLVWLDGYFVSWPRPQPR